MSSYVIIFVVSIEKTKKILVSSMLETLCRLGSRNRFPGYNDVMVIIKITMIVVPNSRRTSVY